MVVVSPFISFALILIIEKKVAKLIKADVIRESHYLDWLANVIVTPKKGGKWRVYVA